MMWLVAVARSPSRWKWGVIALCFTVWFVTNFTKGVHEDEEIERALDILEMLTLMASLTKFVDFSLSMFCFQRAGKDFEPGS